MTRQAGPIRAARPRLRYFNLYLKGINHEF
jgi:hypothetical protein